jgi:hypothetical protein
MIKFTYKYLKPVALFLTIAVMFQCCKVYDKRPVSVDQAINVDHKKVKRIKIDMFGNKKYVLDSIYYKNGELYGLSSKSTKKNIIELRIEEEKIIQIRLYNQKKSKTGTVFAIAIPILGGLTLLILIAMSLSSPFQDGI